MTLLAARNLAKTFRGRRVVDDVSLQVSGGEIVGLLGPNGAGKTTSFYMIVGLVPSDAGTVSINDHDVSDLSMHARANLGLSYLSQEPSVFRKLSVKNNIRAVLQTRKGLGRQQQATVGEELMKRFGIAHLRHNQAMSLSGGERRRLEIARALATDPAFILLDEPFAGVDPISVVEIKRIIGELEEQGIGILITDHNVRETLDICDRAYIINEGTVMAEGSPEQILDNSEVRSVYLGENFTM